MKKTMKCELKEHERLDDLLVSGLKIIQNEREFCFSLDAVLLAHFVHVKKRAVGVDLGTGTGVMPLLLSQRAELIHAIELNSVTADLARRNVALNNLEKKIIVHEGDYCSIEKAYAPQFADFVIANPPYRPLRQGNINELDGVAKARHEITATLFDVVRAGAYCLKFGGRFAMVHLPERLGEIMVAMHEQRIEAKRLRFVQPKADRAPNMLLIEGVYGGALGGLRVDTPLIVHEPDGSYTKELLHYYYPK